MSASRSETGGLTPSLRTWLGHLEAWRAEGGELKAYALEHGLSVSGFYTAKRELTRRGAFPGETSPVQASKFVPVRVTTSAAARGLRVTLPNGLTVEVPEDVDIDRGARLVGALLGMRP